MIVDALDILTDLENVVPFFQPIFSADEHRVIGYEILGRYKQGEHFASLGPFFLDENIPEEFRIEVDNTVLRKALEQSLSLDEDVLLFINRDANMLMHEDEEVLLQLLKGFEQRGIGLNRIVIEISERNYKGDTEHLDHLLNYYRTFGIKLAIDNLGDESSNLDRIGQISPHILKVDLHALRSINTSPRFQEIIYSLSMLARKIGASLLFENIEMVYQFQYAWKNGGRYYQGFYLCEPAADFVDRDKLKEQLKTECHHIILNEKKKLEALYEITEAFQSKIAELLSKNKKLENYEELLKALAKDLDHIAFRMYICDEDGFQESPNIFKNQGGWTIQQEYLHKNWSWRPYFLENIIRMRKEKKGILSDIYNDIETGENIRTFSFPLNTKHYLFIDLSYEFLFEHTELL